DAACDQEGPAERVLAPENLACASLADQHHMRPISDIMLIKIASRQNGNAEGLKISRANVMRRSAKTLTHRRNISLRPCIESSSVPTSKGHVSQCYALEFRYNSKRVLDLLAQTLPSRHVWIARLREGDKADPQMIGPEAERLPAQLDEAGNQ